MPSRHPFAKSEMAKWRNRRQCVRICETNTKSEFPADIAAGNFTDFVFFVAGIAFLSTLPAPLTSMPPLNT